MRITREVALSAFLSLATGGFTLADGQVAKIAPHTDSQAASAAEDAPAVLSRVISQIDETRTVQLHGNTRPMERGEIDEGAVDPQLPMERMILVLKHSPEQEAALDAFMARQLDPHSADYHHWLTPEDFGRAYGLSDNDISAVTNWLQNHGFTIDNVARGRNFIEFSGTAGLVADAFHTAIHHYRVSGEEHIANTTDPSIPEALSPVIEGVLSLHNFYLKPMHVDLGSFHRVGRNGKWEPDNPDALLKPMFNVNDGGAQVEWVAPYDFATIYNVLPLWSAGIDGTGETIAIAGRSNITLSDVATFRSSFGLPANVPTVLVNGTDPGETSVEDRVENTVDVEWAGAVAKGAKIELVTTASTSTTDGAVQSALYIIDNNIAPIMSFSYGGCELGLGTAGNAAFNAMWQEAAADGITVFVSSGDQGSAACDGGQTSPYLPQYGLAVSGTASTPYNVAVGGTDFQWPNLTGTYWNSTNNSTNLSSALGYIPEVPWNSTCASDDIRQLLGFTAAGYTAESLCNELWTISQLGFPLDAGLVNAIGGSGGVSTCTTPSSNTVASCSGGYAKPSWQTATGVPMDSKRDVPDVALFASNGVLNSAYAFCDSGLGACNFSVSADAAVQAVGGTSVASPAMAGIMALVLQKIGGSPQGLANPEFYQLAAAENLSSCNSNTVSGGNSCVFYDITSDNNQVPCQSGTPNCMPVTSGDTVAIMSGYVAATGYDLTTGLGSVNANNLVNAWSSTTAAAVMTSPAPGSTLTSSTTTFTWNAAAGANYYYLWIGTTPGGNNLLEVGLTGTSYTVNLPTSGATIYVRLYSQINGTQPYNSYTYTEYSPGGAVMTSPAPGSTLTSGTTTFTWNAAAGANYYYLWIGTTPGGNNLLEVGLTGTSYTVNLPTSGATIYVRLYSQINGAQPYNSYTYTEYSPGGAVMTSPAPGSTLTSGTTTFTWNAAAGANYYYLWIGTTPGGNNLLEVGLTGTSYTVNLPTSGATIYVRLYSQINGAQPYNSYTYTEYSPAPAIMISPAPGSTLTSGTTTFTWNAAAGANYYYLWIGTTPGGNNLLEVGLTGTSYTVNLPTKGATIYVRLYSQINGAQPYNSYTYTEYSPGGAVMISPAPGSTLSSGTTTFTWNAAAGANYYYLWIGTTPGGNDLIEVGLTGTSYSVNLPANGATIYVRLYSQINGAQPYNSYTYTEF